ncbi:AAEL013604-PA [Aedes aegypti]|uniref:AAEL013604-PA n=1 Tax=Aedes aegypti TaxID=7159 RepID=Q16IN0_AEDAE|nr:AAEL013604-PA [Aedes aegypti]
MTEPSFPPTVLRAEKSTAEHSTQSVTASAKVDLTETSRQGKAILYNMTMGARKPKRSNGEVPLLIIRPIEKKKKKPYKDHMVKIMTGGVASYGGYPEIHSSDHEVFSLEHMLPILGLEGMVFNGGHKHSQFMPSPQYKPSEYHFLPHKLKEEIPVLSSFKPADIVSAQSLPSPPSPNFVPAVNTEEQLLKLGHQALGKLETPGSPAQSQFQPVLPEKPIFIKPDQYPSKYSFQHGQTFKSVPIGSVHPGFGPASHAGMHNEVVMYHKPQFYSSKPSPSYKWQEHSKKPQMVSPLSISTNFYHPKTLPTTTNDATNSNTRQLFYSQGNRSFTSTTTSRPTTFCSSTNASASLSVTRSKLRSRDFVVPKQPSHEEPPKSYYKTKTHKQHHSNQQPTYYIHKQFEYPEKENGNENNVVSEYHGSPNPIIVEQTQQPQEAPYSAPQYLPLQSSQQQHQQPSAALTLHQTHPQPQQFHQTTQQTSAHQNHWKFGRRNHHREHVKPVVEATSEQEQDSTHAASIQSIKTLKPAEKSTTEVKVEIEHVAQSRADTKQQQPQLHYQQKQQQEKGETTTIRATTTRAGRQG